METICVESHLRTFGSCTKGLENGKDIKLVFIRKIVRQIGMPSLLFMWKYLRYVQHRKIGVTILPS
jgi:hypothetical protein